MLTATDLTVEETHEKKNPRFLFLILALFIMAGVSYAAFWWITQQKNIHSGIKKKPIIDASAQAWYKAQQKLMEAKLNPPSNLVTTDASIISEKTKLIEEVKKGGTTEKTSISRLITKPSEQMGAEIHDHDQAYQSGRTQKTFADNIQPSRLPNYFQEDNPKPTYNASIPPTNNKRAIVPVYIPVQPSLKEIEKNVPASNNPLITRDELEEFMRQFSYKKTTIHFVCYSKPNEEMEAVKAQIIQFLRQNGYTDMEAQWGIWLNHTPVKEVHYGKSGLTGANFYIPSFK